MRGLISESVQDKTMELTISFLIITLCQNLEICELRHEKRGSEPGKFVVRVPSSLLELAVFKTSRRRISKPVQHVVGH